MRWKWILSIAAAVVIVGLIVIYIIIASYDFNKLKPQITELAEYCLQNHKWLKNPDLQQLLAADQWARDSVNKKISPA